MDIFDREVRFDKYCETCKHKDKNEKEDPCNECLEYGYNTESEKPVNYKLAKKA